MTISRRLEKFLEKQHSFNSLLCHFLTNTHLHPVRKGDLKTIKKYVCEFDSDSLKHTIDQAKVVLNLKKFPSDRIVRMTNRREKAVGSYKDWVQWMVRTLEDEGKKAGKLNANGEPIININSKLFRITYGRVIDINALLNTDTLARVITSISNAQIQIMSNNVNRINQWFAGAKFVDDDLRLLPSNDEEESEQVLLQKISDTTVNVLLLMPETP